MTTTERPNPTPSAARPSPFPPIADYAFLSNCHTGALVAPDGAIDWLVRPAFDSPSVFGSLLDREAGAFRFGPYGIVHPTARAYDPGTNVLITTWKTPTGWIVVRDALTMGPTDGEDRVTPHTRPPADDDGDHMLVRTRRMSRGNRGGRARLRARLRLRTCARRVGAPVQRPPRRRRDRRRSDRSPAHGSLAGDRGDRVRARHVLERGERAYCSLSWAEDLAGPETSTRHGRASPRRRASGEAGSGARGSRITPGAIRSSARRSRSRG